MIPRDADVGVIVAGVGLTLLAAVELYPIWKRLRATDAETG
jgi:hypothetical protein